MTRNETIEQRIKRLSKDRALLGKALASNYGDSASKADLRAKLDRTCKELDRMIDLMKSAS